MKLKKILSGGQTGADRTGLEEAKAQGIATGGHAPRGYRTETGNDISLKDFGLVETADSGYKTRTGLNVANADCTVWFGKVGSPGYWCTWNAAKAKSKAFIENPVGNLFKELCDYHEVINIAGNRASTNPHVVALVKAAFDTLKP